MGDDGFAEDHFVVPYEPREDEDLRYDEHYEILNVIFAAAGWQNGATTNEVVTNLFSAEKRKVRDAFESFAADLWEVVPRGIAYAPAGHEDWKPVYDVFVARLSKKIKDIREPHGGYQNLATAKTQFRMLLHDTADCVRELVEDCIGPESAGNWAGPAPTLHSDHMVNVETRMGKHFVARAETLIAKHFKWMDPRIEMINEDVHEYTSLYIGAPFVDLGV